MEEEVVVVVVGQAAPETSDVGGLFGAFREREAGRGQIVGTMPRPRSP